jgi:predicted dehydrogenase
MTPVRAAVIGAGFVGGIHARALAAQPDVQLVAICGRTAPRAEALAASHGAAAYTSIPEMLADQRPCMVCVCTGNRDHYDPVMAALAAGCHVFVEKPMAWTVAEASEMVHTAASNGVRLAVNFNHRFSAPFQRALGVVRGQGLGAPAYLDMKFAGSLYKELNDPYCMLIETQGHSFDLLRLFGGEIEAVHAFLGDPRRIGVYTSAAVALRFTSGAVGTLIGSWDSSYDHPGAQSLEVSGTEGRVGVDNIVDAVASYNHGDASYVEWRPSLFDAVARDFWRTIDAHIDAFVAALRAGERPPVTGEDGVEALRLTYAVIASFEQSAPVAV